MKVNRFIFNISTTRLAETRDFYTELFNFSAGYDSNWFVSMQAEGQPFELGIIRNNHNIVPEPVREQPVNGVFLTLVVPDVDALHQEVFNKGIPVLEEPTDTFYGQRRMLIQDPAGTVVDVSTPLPDVTFE